MTLLIDGYNLLNSVGITGGGGGGSSLARSRTALLNFLAELLDPDEAARTTIVFDAKDAPPGLPSVWRHRGLTVRFARGYETADALIEELIEADSAPRQLTVVSSDHELKRAARRRRAKPVDSQRWYARVVRKWKRRRSPPPTPAGPSVPLLTEEVERWLEEFGGEQYLEILMRHEESDDCDLSNPFPPGYGEDLEE